MCGRIHDLPALCNVVKLCYVRYIGLCVFRQTDNNRQVVFWPNDSNGTKRMIETDINDSNLGMVIITAIYFDIAIIIHMSFIDE